MEEVVCGWKVGRVYGVEVEWVVGDGEEGVGYLNREWYWLRCEEIVEVR